MLEVSFANAIFGALAVLFFSAALQSEIKNLPFTAQEKQMVLSEAVNLGNAKAPAELGSSDRAVIERSYRDSFISCYGKIMRISAGLGFSGALMSFIFIGKRKKAGPASR